MRARVPKPGGTAEVSELGSACVDAALDAGTRYLRAGSRACTGALRGALRAAAEPRRALAAFDDGLREYQSALADLALVPALGWQRFVSRMNGERALIPDRERRETHSTAYTVDGVEVRLPVRFHAAQGMAIYALAPDAVEPFLPPGLCSYPGLGDRTVFALRITNYRESDLGSYFEIDVAFCVAPEGSPFPLPGTFSKVMLVGSRFSHDVGHRIWGYPKQVEHLEFLSAGSDHAQCSLLRDGWPMLTVRLRRQGRLSTSDLPFYSYTFKDDRVHRTEIVRSGRGESFIAGGGGVHVEINGDEHPLCELLRQLGLPRAEPVAHLWSEHMFARLGEPVALAACYPSVGEPPAARPAGHTGAT